MIDAGRTADLTLALHSDKLFLGRVSSLSCPVPIPLAFPTPHTCTPGGARKVSLSCHGLNGVDWGEVSPES